jgi:hypothetical protein
VTALCRKRGIHCKPTDHGDGEGVLVEIEAGRGQHLPDCNARRFTGWDCISRPEGGG